MSRIRNSRRLLRPCSDRYRSPLTTAFAASVADSAGDPRRAMLLAVNAALPHRRLVHLEERLLWLQRKRHIRCVRDSSEIEGDGRLEPLGTSFGDGFDLLVSKARSPARRRFTLAHELCHTFFYELVPRVKFSPHREDPCEERLCDGGASEILMPSWQVEAAVLASGTGTREAVDSRDAVTSLVTLHELARQFQVSTPAMMSRLRDLSLSRCRLQVWQRSNSGAFLFPGSARSADSWSALATHVERAWRTGTSVYGHDYLESVDESGVRRVCKISYEARAQGNRIYFLWCKGGLRRENLKSLFSTGSGFA
jgi:Zn-dependent peptidase ImmA (M78 family)